MPETYDPSADGWVHYEADGFLALVGPLWQKPIENGYRYGLLVEDKHHNRRGVLQGGMLMTFADRTMGMTAWYANGQKPQATMSLTVQFIDAVHVGEFVENECQVLRRTRSVIFMAGFFRVGSRLVATANGVWKILGDGSAPTPAT